MKRVIYIAFSIICSLGLPFSAQAQYYTGVLEVFYQSLAYPESFDQYVASNKSLFDSQFFSCLNALEQYWKDQARQEEEVCNTHVDPALRSKCLAQAWFIKLPNWSANIRSVITGQARWPVTDHGAAAIKSKRIVGPGPWVQAANTTFQNEMHRRIYLCQLTSTSANPEEVSKDSWIDGIFTTLPTIFCQQNQYFRQCFDVSEAQCKETTTSATRGCLQKYKDKIPNILKQPKDGTYWGRVIGSCVGEAYEITLLGRRISNQRCNDPNSW